MKTNVFVVNDDTFPIHLQYLFAGTGSKDKDEHIGLLSDIKRIRPNDFVIFYIEGTTKRSGGFYGIFKIANQNPLTFNVTGNNGYYPNLNKKLIYRTLIEPYEVFAKGIPEWEALDKLPVYATDIQWSLIYRKLKAKRGCTPLLPWKSQKLMDMIREKNKGNPIANSHYKGCFDWNIRNGNIITSKSNKNYPYQRNYNFNVLESIFNLYNKRKAFEVNLQLYFTENIGIDSNLNEIVGNNVIWFGNEVACGVGMQKIDILTINRKEEKNEFRLIELKYKSVQPEVVNQIEYYVKWASQDSGRHLEGSYSWNIQPVIVAKRHSKRNWQYVIDALKNYNKKKISLPILYFEFEINNESSITFENIKYE